jgi:hypothetical protein
MTPDTSDQKINDGGGDRLASNDSVFLHSSECPPKKLPHMTPDPVYPTHRHAAARPTASATGPARPQALACGTRRHQFPIAEPADRGSVQPSFCDASPKQSRSTSSPHSAAETSILCVVIKWVNRAI